MFDKPDLADRYIRLPEEALLAYGMLKQSLGRELTETELEDFVSRHERPRAGNGSSPPESGESEARTMLGLLFVLAVLVACAVVVEGPWEAFFTAIGILWIVAMFLIWERRERRRRSL